MKILLRAAGKGLPEVVQEWDDRLIDPAFATHLLTHLESLVEQDGRVKWYWVGTGTCPECCGVRYTKSGTKAARQPLCDVPSMSHLLSLALMGITVQP